MSKASVLVTAIIAAIVTVVTVLLRQPHFFKITPKQRPHVTIAVAKLPVVALVFVANAKQYFKDEGLDVSLDIYTAGINAVNAIFEGKADLATSYDTPVMRKVFEGKDVGILTQLHSGTRFSAVLARQDRGIHVAADLKGKKIGVTRGTGGEFFLSQLLTNQGIQKRDVSTVNMLQQDSPEALKSGRVDAIVTWPPFLQMAREALAPDVSIAFYSDIYREISVLAGRRSFLTERGDLMKPLLRALLRAEQYVYAEPAGTVQILKNYFPQLSESSLRQILTIAQPGLGLSNILLNALEQQSQWLIAEKYYAGPSPDLASRFVTRHLNKLKPELVTVMSTGDE